MKRLLVMSLMLLSSAAFASEKGSVHMKVTAVNVQAIYTNDGSAYNETSASGQKTTVIQGSGLLSAMTNNKVEPMSVDLPNTSIGDYARVGVARLNEHTAKLQLDYLKNTQAGPLSFSYSVEVELVEGTWADFDAGREVKAHLTSNGVRQDRDAQKQIAQQGVDFLVNALKRQGADVKASISSKSSETDVMTLSKTQIIIPSAMSEVEAVLDVTL